MYSPSTLTVPSVAELPDFYLYSDGDQLENNSSSTSFEHQGELEILSFVCIAWLGRQLTHPSA